MEEDKVAYKGLDECSRRKAEKIFYQTELRALELKAYTGVLEALRAAGKPNLEKDGVIKTLKDYFKVPEERHKAEIRQLAYDDNLSTVAEKLTGYSYNEEWAYLAQRKYVPMGMPPYSLFRSFPTTLSRTCTTIRDPIPLRKTKPSYLEEDADVHSDSEQELINKIIQDKTVYNGGPPENPIPVQIAVEPGTGNEEEMDEMDLQIKKKLKLKKHQNARASSPDITDTPRTNNKIALKGESKLTNSVKGRGIKRKDFDDYMIPQDVSYRKSEQTKGRYRIKKLTKTQDHFKASKYHRPNQLDERKISSEETSSADEGENGSLAVDDSSRVLSPVFSEVIRSSVYSRPTKVPRGQTAINRKKNGSAVSPTKAKGGRVRPRTPSQKAAKFRNSTPTSGSRRKSKLNEKIDYDDVLMDLDGNELEKQAVYCSKGEEMSRRLMLDNTIKDETVLFSESLHMNYNHDDMEQVNDGVFKRPLPPSRGPKPWEIKDARLSHREDSISDENSGTNVNFSEAEPCHQQFTSELGVSHGNFNEASTPTTPTKHELPPPPKKQRLKSPLIVNPNLNPSNMSKVPLPAPVFSTSISSLNKKRQNNKPVSVVDSLNLHLPTSATASSLAASSNSRRGGAANSGCSMFSNSSALIAGARGTAPGILQQQRKAQPHILANSKAHQRTFTPTINSCASLSTSISSSVVSPVTVASTYSAGALSPSGSVGTAQNISHAVQFPASPSPMSALSTSPPSSAAAAPFQNFPSANSSSLNLGSTGVPISHVNRPATGPNIILVQKSNGPTVPGAGAPNHNLIPVKTQPRAVILRRAQIPRQPGNVMILDMQNNQVVAPGQAPILQTARILNAPGELSVVNIQSAVSPLSSMVSPTSGMAPQTIVSPESVPIQDIITSANTKTEDEIGHASSQESYTASVTDVTQANHINASTTASLPSPDETEGQHTDQHTNSQSESEPQDAEYAQIEAELMQMEEGSFEEVVYEEEVTTEIVPLEDGGNTQYIFTHETCISADRETLDGTQEDSLQTHTSNSAQAISECTTHHNFQGLSEDAAISQEITLKPTSVGSMGDRKGTTDAVSMALSLSKISPATTSVTLIPSGATTTFLNNAHETCSVVDATKSTEFSVTSTIFEPTCGGNASTLIVAENSSSTNEVNEVNSTSIATVELTLPNNEFLQQSEVPLQEDANVS